MTLRMRSGRKSEACSNVLNGRPRGLQFLKALSDIQSLLGCKQQLHPSVCESQRRGVFQGRCCRSVGKGCPGTKLKRPLRGCWGSLHPIMREQREPNTPSWSAGPGWSGPGVPPGCSHRCILSLPETSRGTHPDEIAPVKLSPSRCPCDSLVTPCPTSFDCVH